MSSAIHQLLDVTLKQGASDLHLSANMPPLLRIDGELVPLTSHDPLTDTSVRSLIGDLMDSEQKDLFNTNKEIDFSFEYGKYARFRVNAYHQLGTASAALRLITMTIPKIDDLHLPPVCKMFSELKQGLVLVTGPTGHGKSTTLAAIIGEINESRSDHVVTIEDPIEYVHLSKKALVSQREMHTDSLSWNVALKSVLREDPDVVLIGEMRDFETIAAALTIAETGHLVFATLHTNSAAQTIDRIVDVFPPHQQSQVRLQLAATIEGVFSQRLLPAIGGGRVVAYEILLANPAVRNVIREGKTHMIDNIVMTSTEMGMTILENRLAQLVNEGMVAKEVAMRYAIRPDELSRQIFGKKR